MLIANSNLVPHWATWEHFNELDRKGLMMFGQMTAGSWIYIGSQGIVQGTYETFAEMARQHFGGAAAGKWILTAGLGGMGGAQPLAATMAGLSMLAIECQADRIDKRLATGYLDRRAADLDEALAMLEQARRGSRAGVRRAARQRRRGAAGTPAPRRAPDAVTDQTSAHDPVHGYLPDRLDRGEAGATAQDTRPGGRGRCGARLHCHPRARHARIPAKPACRSSTTATTSARSRSRRA